MIQSGIQTGIDVAPQVGLNPTSGFPTNLSQWLAAGLPAIDSLWLFDEASGDFLDRVGSHDFSIAAGSVARRVPTPYGRGVRLDSSDAQLQVSSTSFMDAGSDTDLSLFILCRHPGTAVTKPIVHKRLPSSPHDGWQLNIADDGDLILDVDGDDGGDPIDGIFVLEDHRNVFYPITATFNPNGPYALNTPLGTAASTADVGDTTNVTPLTIGRRASENVDGLEVVLLAVRDGSAWTADERQKLVNYFKR